jgi:hypothetical protein
MAKHGQTGGNNNPFSLYNPQDIILFLSFFSPVIVATSITSMSFIFQNFNGLIYLGFLLASCVIRHFLYFFMGIDTLQQANDNTVCSAVQYSKYGNASYSAFVFAFTLMYISFPMFTTGAPNFWIFSVFIIYFFIDIFVKYANQCIKNTVDILFSIILGLGLSAGFVCAMYYGGSAKYLIFNEVSSNKDICYQPKKQTFRCNMYKNGQLISGSNV